MRFFDQWLLRLILTSLLAAVPFLLYSVLLYFRPRAFNGRQKRRFWLALFLLFLLTVPLPRLLPLPQPVYQAVSFLRLPSLQTPRLTEYQLIKAGRDINSHITIIPADGQAGLPESGNAANSSFISRQIAHQVLDYVEITLPWLRWLYPASLLILSAVLLYKNHKRRMPKRVKPVPGTESAPITKPVPGTETAGTQTESEDHQKSQRIHEWSIVVNAWRDALGFYRRCTIRVSYERNSRHSLINTLQRIVMVPDRKPMQQDHPDYWRNQESISAPVAMALYDLQHPEHILTGLYKLVRFITWFNPLWLWMGAVYRGDRQQYCQEALAAHLKGRGKAASIEKNRTAALRKRPRLADTVLPVCLAGIAAILLIQMPGLIVPVFQPLSRTQENLFPDDSSWPIDYRQVSDDPPVEPAQFDSYQVSESFLNGRTALRLTAAVKHLAPDVGSDEQNEVENLVFIEKRDPDNRLIWQFYLSDCSNEFETIIYPFIIDHREMDDGSINVLYRALGFMTGSGDSLEQYFTCYYMLKIAQDGQLLDYYRLDISSGSDKSFIFLDNGDLLHVEQIGMSETGDFDTSQFQIWLTRYDGQGQIVWQLHDQQLDRSGDINSGAVFYNQESVLLAAADRQNGFYLVLQNKAEFFSTQSSSPQSKFLNSLIGSSGEQINPYSYSFSSSYSLSPRRPPRITAFYQPARIIHYDQSGQQTGQLQLQQNSAEIFVPQHGFVTEQNELILTGQTVDQELCGMLPSLLLNLQYIDQNQLQSAISDTSISLLPAEQFAEAYVRAQIIAISPKHEVIWSKIFPGFSTSVLDYLNDSSGFTVLIEEPLPILDIDNIKSGRYPAGPFYGSIYNPVFPYGSVFSSYLLSRQHLVRFDLSGQIEAWQMIEPEEMIGQDSNTVVTAVFADADRIICQMQ